MQAIGLAWIAAVSTPTTPYAEFIGAFALSGIGMALFFAPVANVVLSSVRREEEGQASGANNAIRELGGVFGVAVLAAVFAGKGGYGSGQQFVDGMNPAVGDRRGARRGRRPRRVRDQAQPAEPSTSRSPARSDIVTACACASCWCAPPSDASDTEDQDRSSPRMPTLAGAS